MLPSRMEKLETKATTRGGENRKKDDPICLTKGPGHALWLRNLSPENSFQRDSWTSAQGTCQRGRVVSKSKKLVNT